MKRIDEPSILQTEKCCWLCGNTNPNVLERHEAFFGSLHRQQSIDDRLTVLLCRDTCHRNGKYAVHQAGGVGNKEEIQRQAQQAAMDFYGWTTEQFIARYGKNYI